MFLLAGSQDGRLAPPTIALRAIMWELSRAPEVGPYPARQPVSQRPRVSPYPRDSGLAGPPKPNPLSPPRTFNLDAPPRPPGRAVLHDHSGRRKAEPQ